MSKGHIFLAQNTEGIDYVKQAYALALSIKVFNKEFNQTCLVTNDVVPEEYLHAFDHIVPIPWKDSARNSKWKIENRWKLIHATPFEENLVYDTDMLLLSSNDHFWKQLESFNFAFTENTITYKGEKVSSNFYRKTFVENNLPNVYSGFFYFKKIKETFEFFKWLEVIVKNWDTFYKKYLPKSTPTGCSIDVSAALTLKLSGMVNPKVPILKFVHMKPQIQNWNNVPSKCYDVLDYYLNENLSLFVGNFKQNILFHYVEKDFLTDEILGKLKDEKEKIDSRRNNNSI
jgi:hypothetical protein